MLGLSLVVCLVGGLLDVRSDCDTGAGVGDGDAKTATGVAGVDDVDCVTDDAGDDVGSGVGSDAGFGAGSGAGFGKGASVGTSADCDAAASGGGASHFPRKATGTMLGGRETRSKLSMPGFRIACSAPSGQVIVTL